MEEKEEALGVSREGVNMTPFNPVSWEIQGWDLEKKSKMIRGGVINSAYNVRQGV